MRKWREERWINRQLAATRRHVPDSTSLLTFHAWPELSRMLLYLTLILILTSCAQPVAPGGGPVDKTPPLVIQVTPENKSTLVPARQKIEFVFSERMNRQSLEKAIFITPAPGRKVKYKWKGRKLRLEPGDTLKANRTYLFTLGTDLKDAHGNALAQSFTLAFSTGAKISDGKISGRVYGASKSRGVLIWAYILEENQDPDPVNLPATYVTQTDNSGKYNLSYLSSGRYRIFAIDDLDGNRFFESGSDGIGLPQKDLYLTTDSAEVKNFNFRISVKDTLGPALISVQADDRTSVKLRFDENIEQSLAGQTANYSIFAEKKGAGDSLQIRVAYVNPLDSTEVKLLTTPQTRGAEYFVSVDNLTDKSGNLVDTEFNRVLFTASALSDTFRPQLLKTIPKDSAWAVALNSQFLFIFNEPIRKTLFENHLVVSDADSNIINGTFNWITPASVSFNPANELLSLTRYHITTLLDSVLDYSANAVADSALQLIFTSINIDTLSSISGTVSDQDSTGFGRIFLTAKQKTRGGVSYYLELADPGPYKFESILPGQYSIEGFRDTNGDGEYGFGSLVPYVPAERFIFYADSIIVRARWPNEGNDISFPKL